MQTDTKQTNNQNVQQAHQQLSDLLKDAKKVNQEIGGINDGAKKDMDDLDFKVDQSIKNVEQIYSDLDRIEKDAGDELDNLVLHHAEDLASEID